MTGAKYIGQVEFQDKTGDWHYFDVLCALAPSKRIVFGCSCNVGFLESGFILREEGESVDDTLAEMLADLETYYNDGPQFTARITITMNVTP